MAVDKSSRLKEAKAKETARAELAKEMTDRFAKTLVELREDADLTQQQLATRAGVNRAQITLMERGDRLPRFPTVVRVAGALGVDPGVLFRGIVFEPPTESTGEFVIE